MHEGCFVVEHIHGDQVEKEELDKASMTHGNYHSSVQQFFICNLKRRDLLGNLGLSWHNYDKVLESNCMGSCGIFSPSSGQGLVSSYFEYRNENLGSKINAGNIFNI